VFLEPINMLIMNENSSGTLNAKSMQNIEMAKGISSRQGYT
jgi:hypothetical protein